MGIQCATAKAPPREVDFVRRNFIFTLLGTGGDVWPGVAIAAELQRRGHSVVVLTYDYFAEAVRNAGLHFQSAGESQAYLAQVTTPEFWERHGTSKGLNENGYLRLALPPVYDYIASRLDDEPCLVCTRNAYGARFAAEKFGLPILCLAFSSTQFASAERFPYSAPWLARMPLWARRISMALGDALYNQPLLKKLNPLREGLSLPPVRRMRDWSFFETPSLALYPSWYNDVSDLAHLRIKQTGFVFAHANEKAPLPASLEAFLSEGPPPVVVTFGTGVAHVRDVFDKVARALARLGLRAVYVTPFQQNLPADLDRAITIPYADFSALLPRAAMLVHHGGIGSAAQAVRAGIPQVIVPLAFDQPDNARRLRTLGLGEFVQHQRFKVPELEQALKRALTRTDWNLLVSLKTTLTQSDGSADAAENCESFFKQRGAPVATCVQ